MLLFLSCHALGSSLLFIYIYFCISLRVIITFWKFSPQCSGSLCFSVFWFCSVIMESSPDLDSFPAWILAIACVSIKVQLGQW